ncbi:MAG: RdgB/HAM1 family non-canonical purine NTP pyrophosphatase [Acidimicrobiales bacterium]
MSPAPRTAGRLVLATANQGKVAELVGLLGHRYQVEPRPADLPETVEDGDSLDANARKKAIEVAGRTRTLALADDSGLFVDALGGRPGVHTARFAGEHATSADNVAALLAAMVDLREGPDRSARFVTVIAMAWPGGEVRTVQGEVAGVIVRRPAGDNGFGYDPVFSPDEGDGRTFAEMSPEEKQAISHRARAVAAAVDLLDGPAAPKS